MQKKRSRKILGLKMRSCSSRTFRFERKKVSSIFIGYSDHDVFSRNLLRAASIPEPHSILYPRCFNAFSKALTVKRVSVSDIIPMHPIRSVLSLSFPAPPAITTLYFSSIILRTEVPSMPSGLLNVITV